MLELWNGNLKLLLSARQPNRRQYLRVSNKDSSQNLLHIITLGRRYNLLRLTLNLVNIPVGKLLQRILKYPEDTTGILLGLLCLFQQIQIVSLQSRNEENTKLSRVLCLGFAIYSNTVRTVHVYVSFFRCSLKLSFGRG